MEENYWEQEGTLWYYYDANWTVRYRLDFENSSVIEQYRMMGEWEDGNSVSFILFPPTLEEAKLTVEGELRNKEREDQDFYNSIMAECIEEENRILQERDSWKEKLKGLIKVKKLWRELEEDYENSWGIDGIVELELTDEKKSGYSKDYQCARIKEERGYLYTDWNGKGVFNWQQTGYLGDDYSGYLLYPLKNGKYLKVSYSC
jgi:hypothetical protein